MLREVKWKEHRNAEVLEDRRNLGLELADLTKYVFSLWQLHGYTLREAMDMTLTKSLMLEAQYTMDFSLPPSAGTPILIADIDGTLGDYRKAFKDWLGTVAGYTVDEEEAKSLLFDLDNSMEYPNYYSLKEEFEKSGGYSTLPPYWDAVELVEDLRRELGVLVVVYTARPAGRYKYIWLDTYHWLMNHGINPWQLHMGEEERVLQAVKLRDNGNPVVMLEDNPTLIRRASRSGIPVFGRSHYYNMELVDTPNVTMVPDYVNLFTEVKEAYDGQKG